MCAELNVQLTRFDATIKRLNEIQIPDSKREQTLLNNLKVSFIQVLQDNLPAYRVMHKVVMVL